MISTKGCGKELRLHDYNFSTMKVSTIEMGEWYPVREDHPGPDTYLSAGSPTCGVVTVLGKYMRLCDHCARQEGLKW